MPKRKMKSAEELIHDMNVVSNALIDAVRLETAAAKGARKRRLQSAIACLCGADDYIKKAVEKIK